MGGALEARLGGLETSAASPATVQIAIGTGNGVGVVQSTLRWLFTTSSRRCTERAAFWWEATGCDSAGHGGAGCILIVMLTP